MNANRVDSVDCCLSESTSDSPALDISEANLSDLIELTLG